MPEPTFEDVPLSQLFPEDKLGWRGYIEWEDKPDRKAIAKRILATKKFTPSPEFQLEPLPPWNGSHGLGAAPDGGRSRCVNSPAPV